MTGTDTSTGKGTPPPTKLAPKPSAMPGAPKVAAQSAQTDDNSSSQSGGQRGQRGRGQTRDRLAVAEEQRNKLLQQILDGQIAQTEELRRAVAALETKLDKAAAQHASDVSSLTDLLGTVEAAVTKAAGDASAQITDLVNNLPSRMWAKDRDTAHTATLTTIQDTVAKLAADVEDLTKRPAAATPPSSAPKRDLVLEAAVLEASSVEVHKDRAAGFLPASIFGGIVNTLSRDPAIKASPADIEAAVRQALGVNKADDPVTDDVILANARTLGYALNAAALTGDGVIDDGERQAIMEQIDRLPGADRFRSDPKLEEQFWHAVKNGSEQAGKDYAHG